METKLQFASTAFESRLSHSGEVEKADVALLATTETQGGQMGAAWCIDELTLNGKILAEGDIIFEILVYGCLFWGITTKDRSLKQ